VDGFAYFTIRLRVPSSTRAAPVSGVIENLATGQKSGFESGDELLSLVRDWSGFVPVSPTRVLPDHPSQ
jgi:hypothetical protein